MMDQQFSPKIDMNPLNGFGEKPNNRRTAGRRDVWATTVALLTESSRAKSPLAPTSLCTYWNEEYRVPGLGPNVGLHQTDTPPSPHPHPRIHATPLHCFSAIIGAGVHAHGREFKNDPPRYLLY